MPREAWLGASSAQVRLAAIAALAAIAKRERGPERVSPAEASELDYLADSLIQIVR